MTTVLLALLGLTILLLVASSELEYTLRRIWAFQHKHFRRQAGKGRAELLSRFGHTEQYQVDLREIRDFVISLHLGTSMEETLSGALSQAAEQLKNRSVFGERLYKHVQTRLSIAPEQVIQGLVEDFRSEQLRDLVQRLEMARDGGISYDRALSLTVEQIQDEIRGDIRRDIQQLPIQLTLPMITAVFLPAIMIGLFPIVVTFLSQISLRFTGG